MKFKGLVLAGFSAFLIYLTGCTKIENSTMGGDLIPAVDNINTFDTLIRVIANNYLPTDSTRITQGADHVAGGIYNDPLFGNAKSTIFFEVKPFAFPYKFTDSTKFFDSAVLVLRYNGSYGDSSFPVQFNLYEVDRKMQFDTSLRPIYTINPDLNPNRSRFWGTKTMQANRYKDTVFIKRGDSVYNRVNNQLRIPLNATLARAMFEGDSARVFGSDSIYKSFLPGFALEPQGSPMALHYFSLAQNGGTEIQFYYRAKNGSKFDTLMRAFGLTSASGHAVKFERNRTGAEINGFLTENNTVGATQLYIDGTPGAMVNIKVPDLRNITNRVLHRAELVVTELSPETGVFSQFTTPRALYLDAQSLDDPTSFRGVPYDLSPFSRYYCYPAQGVDFNTFGGPPEFVTINGVRHTRYAFNLTRYIQSVITRNEPSFNLRLSAPYNLYYKDCANPTPGFLPQVYAFTAGTSYINNIGQSRVKLGGSAHPDPRFRMYLRLIYSKL